MHILGIDSSTENLHIALSSPKKLISEARSSNTKKHMVHMMGCIDSVLGQAGMDIQGVHIFAANTGPGDFTGTRIGLSVAKILAWAEHKPVYGITAPDILAVQAFSLSREPIIAEGRAQIVCCMDVKREEVYSAFYHVGKSDILGKKNGNQTTYEDRSTALYRTGSVLTGHQHVQQEILARLDQDAGPMYICGNAAQAYRHLFDPLLSRKKIYFVQKAQTTDAAVLNRIAHYRHGVKHAQANLVPFYIRDFVPFGGKK